MSSTTLQYATSKDGTTIAFDRLGDGPPVVLVSGGSVDRSSNAGLAEQLASGYTVLNYDRRGRGPSGDTQPYAIDREIEDIDAVIEAAGGKAHLYGSSSGAALALLAAGAGSNVDKLALREPPYIVDDSRPKPDPNTAQITATSSHRTDAATRSNTSWPRSSGCPRSSWPRRGPSRGGNGRSPSPTPWL